MKKRIGLLIGFLLMFSVVAEAQGHTVTLNWTASSDAVANPTLTYNTYRLNGACPATAPTSVSGSGFTKINTAAITTTTYANTGVAPGTYCYFATSFLNSTESVPSSDASAIALPAAPTSFGVSTVTFYFNDGESQVTWKIRGMRGESRPGRMLQVEVPA